ncbi:neuropilin and tolloid-like protein 1 isoform X2 [Mercenaria mercenaria]|uniref:neuropilin and tolloid-like protein 1 isoform X2 n=1 Tax=Mercenaria mercenaria TaxID=6596 RepID=UPI00234F685B|nr:neuropilin and tolloid-like protein 1 isoform X2 [Mercenaria mercenaria]
MDLLTSTKAFQCLSALIALLQLAAASKLGPSLLTVEPPPMVNDYINPACYNFTHGNYHNMEFYSPGYPKQYPNKIDCVMYLQAPHGFNIMMYFMDKFSVEESEGCKFDFIELRDGPFGYSKFIARFCGEGFPVTIHTESRFLWARFASDDLVQFDGFRAVYEYKIDEDYNPMSHSEKVCRIYMDNMAQDGELNSKVFPLADTSRRDYPIEEPVDCTWEMLADRGHRILLSEIKLHMLREGQCNRNRIELYDRTSSEEDRTGVYCSGPVQDYRSESNRVYLRILGSRLSEKPVIFGRYTVYKPARTKSNEPCDSNEFHCDGMCLSQALVCNGHKNCPDSGDDEKGCETDGASSSDSQPIPLMILILAGVGGLILVIIIIGICATCRYRRSQRNKRKSGLQRQDSQKRNALEMAVSDSTNTAHLLAKQNNQGSYYSLPRPAGQATMMQHRGSFSSKVPSEGEFGDHMSDSSTYKKFLQLEQNLDDDSSRCPSPYSPGFTTIIEQHPLPPGMTPDLGWNYQGDASVPSLAENLSKLQQYTSFSSSLPKTIPTQTGENPNTGMTMEFRYDPSPTVYPASKFRIKSPDLNYGWNPDNKTGSPPVKSLTFKNQDADVAPDLTREIETT